MNRFALALTVVAAFTLSACQDFTGLTKLIPVATQSIANPVTPQRLYQAENATIVAVAGLSAYKRACVNGQVPRACREIIGNIQVYTRKMQAMLPGLRRYVRENDQVNAIQAFNLIMDLYDNAKAQAPAGVIPPAS